MADRKTPWLLLLVPLLGLALGYLIRVATRPSEGAADAGTNVSREAAIRPEIRLTTVEGDPVTGEDLEGRAFLLDFWASWCGPCRIQAEILEPLQDRYRGRVEFLAVNLGESEATVRAHLEEEPLPYRVLLDRTEALGVALGIYALPSVAIFDGEGRLTYLHQGITARTILERELDKASARTVASY